MRRIVPPGDSAAYARLSALRNQVSAAARLRGLCAELAQCSPETLEAITTALGAEHARVGSDPTQGMGTDLHNALGALIELLGVCVRLSRTGA